MWNLEPVFCENCKHIFIGNCIYGYIHSNKGEIIKSNGKTMTSSYVGHYFCNKNPEIVNSYLKPIKNYYHCKYKNKNNDCPDFELKDEFKPKKSKWQKIKEFFLFK